MPAAWAASGSISIARACAAPPREARRWLALAERDLAALRREDLAFGRAVGAMVAASLAYRRGEHVLAARELATAHEAAAAHGMRLHAALAELARAGLTGADPLPAMRELASLGVREPARMLALWLPGVPIPASRRGERGERPA